MKYRISLAALVLMSLMSLSAGKKLQSTLVSFHVEGDETDNPRFVLPVKLGDEHRQYFFSRVPSFTDSDIQWFYPFVSEDGASYGAAFRLKDHAAIELKGICLTNPGKLIGCRVVGAPFSAVMIDRPIDDGVIVVWSGISQQNLSDFRKKFPHVDDFRGVSSQSDTGPQFELPTKRKKNPFSFKKADGS